MARRAVSFIILVLPFPFTLILCRIAITQAPLLTAGHGQSLLLKIERSSNVETVYAHLDS